jgi:FKBP-type peptidyl-prolyl cis-trans isomerase
MIYKKGVGDSLAKTGQYVNVRVKMELLNGTMCYETPKDETENFVLEKSEKESGIHEALRLMKKGDKAKLILPSYLGHGLLGDQDKIPPQSILYIDLELVDLK